MTSSEHKLTTFGNLQPGDVVLGPDGEEVVVRAAYEPHLPERMYELEFDDGTILKASGNHLWYIKPQSDLLEHSSRLSSAKCLLKSKEWREEAIAVAEGVEPYEIGLEDLMEFFNFIEDYDQRYFLLLRVAESIGHIVEEEVAYQDYFSGEETNPSFEKVYDARRFFQQMLSLTGSRKYRRRWPVIVGRVVTTDLLFARYPDAEIPSPKE